jgi:hypothetical protein
MNRWQALVFVIGALEKQFAPYFACSLTCSDNRRDWDLSGICLSQRHLSKILAQGLEETVDR